MDSRQGSLIKQVVFDPGNSQMMFKIGFHPLKAGCLQMTSSHDSRGQRLGRAVGEVIDQVVLIGQNLKFLFGTNLVLPNGSIYPSKNQFFFCELILIH